MISITGKVYLASVGGNERVFEDVYASVKIKFIKDETPTIGDIEFSNTCTRYIQSLGATVDHWKDRIVEEFNSNDYLLSDIMEELEDSEYSKLEPYITAYDTEDSAIPVQKSDISDILGL